MKECNITAGNGSPEFQAFKKKADTAELKRNIEMVKVKDTT